MPTQTQELYLKNKNRAKRDASSAAFTFQMELPGGNTLPTGSHILGKLEGNVVITRVVLLTLTGFGAGVLATITDNNGNTYFTDADISTEVVEESALTANAVTRPAPIYSEGVTEFTLALASLNDIGEAQLIVDYTQLDTVTGKHTR